jgi:TP901 family phage tail tape measure protein
MDSVEGRIGKLGQTFGTGMIGVGGAVSDIGGKISDMGSKIRDATQPLQQLMGQGLNVSATFEDTMVQLQTFGNLSGTALEDVRNKALQLGADTTFSAGDAAAAMLELVKAGYDTKTAMADAGLALNLAAVGGMSLNEAAGIVSSTIAQFKLDPINDANKVVDLLAAGANASRADVAGLSDSLRTGGIQAASMGISLKDTVAALSVMANAGIEGADAGTQLKSALVNLTTSSTAKDTLDKLGVSLYDSSGKMKDMNTVIGNLSTAMKDFTPEEKTNAMKDLGGTYGMTALNALLAAGGTKDMISAMGKAPSAADLAKQSMETFNGKVEGLKGSLETLAIKGLTPVQNALKPIVDQLVPIVNSVGDWAAKNPQLTTTLGIGVLAITGLGIAAGIAGPLIGLLGGGISLLGGAISLALSPLGLLVIAGAGLVALLSNPQIQEGLKSWQGVFDNLKIILQAIVDSIKSKLDEVAVGFRSFVRDIGIVIDDLKGKAAAAQVVLGINVDVNTQIVQDTENSKNAAIFAKQLESDINASLASGGPLTIDTGTLKYAASANGGAGIEDLAKKIADPVAIQQAIDQAVANGDTGGLQALLPLQLKLSNDPHAEMQRLLTEALDVGGPNGQDAFNALVPMATEMQIDVPSLVDQYDKKLKEAASAKTYDVTVTANVHVNTNVDTAGFGVAAQTGGAQAASGSSIPGFASGGYINSSGLAYVHGGEMVLNPAQQAAFAGSGGGGTKIYNITVIGQAPHEVAGMVSRANKEQDR